MKYMSMSFMAALMVLILFGCQMVDQEGQLSPTLPPLYQVQDKVPEVGLAVVSIQAAFDSDAEFENEMAAYRAKGRDSRMEAVVQRAAYIAAQTFSDGEMVNLTRFLSDNSVMSVYRNKVSNIYISDIEIDQVSPLVDEYQVRPLIPRWKKYSAYVASLVLSYNIGQEFPPLYR